MSSCPPIHLLPHRHRRVAEGHPWIFANEVAMDGEAKALPPGALVSVVTANGRRLGTAYFNPHSLICARMLSRDPGEPIDAAWIARRLARAEALRRRFYDAPYYRLVHGEADGLPGLIVDRYGDLVAVQANTAGMDRLEDAVLAALAETCAPAVVVLRNDADSRRLEGLEQTVRVARGAAPPRWEIAENGTRFLFDPCGGQKTGWFYDQRESRALVARLCRGRRVADFYSYLGGFALQAAMAGAAEVLAVDRSEPALALAREAAGLNGVAGRCRMLRAEAFEAMERLAGEGARFDVVVADPPAFVRSRKQVAAGERAYAKLARLAAALVAPGGLLYLASCSHHLDRTRFADAIHGGIARAGRSARTLHQGGAAPDHPVHPQLPESAYLKSELLALD